MGRIVISQRRYSEAIEYYEKLYKLYYDISGPTAVTTFHSIENKAYVYHCMGKYGEAIRILEKANESIEKITADNLCVVSKILNSLSVCYFHIEEYVKAENTFMKLGSLLNKFHTENFVFDNEWKETVKNVSEDIFEMAFEFSEIGEYKRAASMFYVVYELCEIWLGYEHNDTLSALSKSAYYNEEIGESQKAIELYKTLYKLRREVLGDTHKDTLATLHNLISLIARKEQEKWKKW